MHSIIESRKRYLVGNIIANLLNAEEPMFSMAIKRLETSSGNPGMDVRIMSEIIQATKIKVNELGFDQNDTTGEELYYALMTKIKSHDEHLLKHIGVADSNKDVESLSIAIKTLLEKPKIAKNAWVLKKSIAKRLLHQTPPEKVMKHLGYSSVESMTKRENLAEIYGALRFVETAAWLKKFNKTYKQLHPSDFENRDIEVVVVHENRWGNLANSLLAKKQYNITHIKEMGFVVILPPHNKKYEGFAIATLSAALHYINEIRLYSAYFKLQQVKQDFGKIIASTLNDDIGSHAEMGGSKIHWRIIQRHYGHISNDSHPEAFQPHIQPEDLLWRRTEEELFLIDPELNFWKGMDYVGALLGSNNPVSFNLLDVSMNYYFSIDYKDRIVSHMRASLWNELYMRYLGQKVFENQVLSQLDGNMMNPESLIL